MLKTISGAIRNYASNPDPLADVAGKIALVVGSNQPFYPLYLHGVLGAAAWPGWLLLIWTPFYLAVPALARRHALLGRVMLPAIGIANTMLAARLFGAATGMELFLLPCALLGALLFRPRERLAKALVIIAPFLAYLVIDPRLGPPIVLAGSQDAAAVVAVNALSVAGLTILIGLLFASLVASRVA